MFNNLFQRYFGKTFLGFSKKSTGVMSHLFNNATGNAVTRRIANTGFKSSAGYIRSRAMRYHG